MFDNWYSRKWDEPNNMGGYQNCVYLQWPDKQWLDGDCDDMRNTVCEILPTLPKPTQQPPPTTTSLPPEITRQITPPTPKPTYRWDAEASIAASPPRSRWEVAEYEQVLKRTSERNFIP